MLAKIKRQFTSILPVSKYRKGNCVNCGRCCKLPFKCPFLKIKDNKAHCVIYAFRPLSCKKYPRTETECLTETTCGFKFEKKAAKSDSSFSLNKIIKKCQKIISFDRA